MREGKARHSKGWAGPEDEATCRAQKPSPLVRTTRVVLIRLPEASMRLTRVALTRLPNASVRLTRTAANRPPKSLVPTERLDGNASFTVVN